MRCWRDSRLVCHFESTRNYDHQGPSGGQKTFDLEIHCQVARRLLPAAEGCIKVRPPSGGRASFEEVEGRGGRMCGDRVRIFANGVPRAGLKWQEVGTEWIAGDVRQTQVHLNFEGRLGCLAACA